VNLSETIIRVLRDFGVVGLSAYIGGLLLLTKFVFEGDILRQIIYGIAGLVLIGLSIYIAYVRLTIQKEREKALISMAESTCNRLAEQVAKNLNDHQVDAIIQKIRQTQRDLILSVSEKVEAK
jgi:hypothetical protein